MAKTSILLLFLLCHLSTAERLFRFLESYASESYFKSPAYAVIDCLSSNDALWPRFVPFEMLTIHRPKDGLSWVDEEMLTFLVNLQCPESESLLREGNRMNLFRMPFRWLLFNSQAFENVTEEESRYWEALQDLNLGLDSEVRLATRGDDDAVRIVEAFKFHERAELTIEEIGEWTLQGGLTIRSKEPTAVRRWNVNGAPLIGSLVVTHPDTMNHLDDLIDKHIDAVSKIGYTAHKLLSEMINASLQMKTVDSWGLTVNGTWTGMLGDLQAGAVHVGLTPGFMAINRMHIVFYYEVITPTRYEVVCQASK